MSERICRLPGPVAVVCHDAGAANIILALIDASPECPLLPVMEGPAAALWEAKYGSRVDLISLDAAIAKANSVLSGTGWASDLEHEGRRLAIAHGLTSAALVDHWVNYAERFERHGEVILPHQVWVTDLLAFAQARKAFPGTEIVLVPNLYIAQQVKAIRPIHVEEGRILYVLEPIRYTWPGLAQPGEFEALDFFADNMSHLPLGCNAKLRLRPHPSDPAGKYDAWIDQHRNIDVALDDSPTLIQAIGRSAWVAGCETTALVVAIKAGRRVVATLPPGAPDCRLPQRRLIHLRRLVETHSSATDPTQRPHQ